MSDPTSARARLWPLHAAALTTAFGAHGVAASLGVGGVSDLLVLGALLALYDGAEVVLKPVLGALADRVGARPVLLAGLLAFALASAVGALEPDPGWLWVTRLGQGAAASAFSPAASSLLARLSPGGSRGRAFGTYGASKAVGYTAGPLLGGMLVAVGGLALLLAVLAGLALAVAAWAAVAVPAAPPLPRRRQTVLDLGRRLADPSFLGPTAALAATTAALAVGVGFLPVTGARAGLGPLATGAAVSLLALTSAVVQPRVGRALDTGRLHPGRGSRAGLALTALGLAAGALPGPAGVLLAAVVVGAGVGVVTPLAFAVLAASTPPERLGATMGSAELGRELGDAGGPLLVGVVAVALAPAAGFLVLAGVVALPTAAVARRARTTTAAHPEGERPPRA